MKNNSHIPLFVVLIVLLIFYLLYVNYSRNQINQIILNQTAKRFNNQNQELDLEKENIIHNIRPNQIIVSPLTIGGKARGFWFFEASFPIKLLDENYKEIATTIATAKSDWMTEDFVEFDAIINFKKPNSKKGFILFQKDNPSGLSENEEKIYIPIIFN